MFESGFTVHGKKEPLCRRNVRNPSNIVALRVNVEEIANVSINYRS